MKEISRVNKFEKTKDKGIKLLIECGNTSI